MTDPNSDDPLEEGDSGASEMIQNDGADDILKEGDSGASDFVQKDCQLPDNTVSWDED